MVENKKNILIVDDEADIRNLVKGILEDEGYGTFLAASSAEAYAALNGDDKSGVKAPDLIVLDIWLQGSEHDGLQILETVKKSHPHLPVIMISGHGTIETAVAAIKQGAYDFIEKPFKSDRLLLMVQRALEAAALKRENTALKRQAERPSELVGESSFIRNLRDVLKRVSPTNSRVLLTGEAGTGKNISARIIHGQSLRAEQPFLMLNCATLRPERLEVELFGEEDSKGDGKVQAGVLENADGGTLFLDEIADMPLETQGKIIRVLQEQSFQRVGGDKPVHVDVRVIASSNHDLEKAIENGSFREDLYYRLNVVPIAMKALRERPEDVEALVAYFLSVVCNSSSVKMRSFSKDALTIMRDYDWPGNVRQLHNVVEWVMIMHGTREDGVFGVEHLPPELRGGEAASTVVHRLHAAGGFNSGGLLNIPLREAREMFERDYLFSQVERFGGNISKTAQFIGMERSALHRKLKSLQQSQGKAAGDAGLDQVKEQRV